MDHFYRDGTEQDIAIHVSAVLCLRDAVRSACEPEYGQLYEWTIRPWVQTILSTHRRILSNVEFLEEQSK